jgi:hypothetical protein
LTAVITFQVARVDEWLHKEEEEEAINHGLQVEYDFSIKQFCTCEGFNTKSILLEN